MTRVVAAHNYPRRISDRILYAEAVAARMKGNPWFPSPTPTIATFEADIAALEVAHVRTLTGAFDAFSDRDAKLAVVKADLDGLRAYVQTVADASVGEAAVVITSAGMSVKHSSGHPKPLFEAKQGRLSGTAHLVAKALPTRSSYDWQSSLDGVVWTDLERTMRANADVSALVPGTRYLFRFRALTKDGAGEWSQALSLLVT